MKKIVLTLVLISIIMNINPLEIEANNLSNLMYERAYLMSDIQVRWDSDLTYPQDKPTQEQVRDRVDSVLYWSYQLNELYPHVLWRDVAFDMYAIIEHETSFVNYANLDGGLSLGIISAQWTTAQEILENLGYDKQRWEFLQDTDLQVKVALHYYYGKLRMYNGRRDLAIVAYNRGFNVDTLNQRYESYYFSVRGRVSYIEERYRQYYLIY